ncbi:MAG: 4Fe-4S dicluster domain-containing protein [Calditerrivibrio sp.]|nr:4Fe-4S dicluster domain-containing protein [Calditerrivibrio sp.]
MDPLVALTTLLSTYRLETIFLWSIPFLLFTGVMGRFFCGWVCPMGTLNHIVSMFSKKVDTYRYDLHKLKYYLFILLVTLSLFGINFSGYLDPLSILVKGLSIFILPIVSQIYDVNIFPEVFKNFLFYNVMGRERFYYHQSMFVGLFFLFILGMNLYYKRFWCVALCPLGALYGFIAKFSMFKIRRYNGCSGCQRCDRACYAGQKPSMGEIKSSECMLLFDCLRQCPTGVLKYEKSLPYSKIDLEKRSSIHALMSGFIAVLLIKSGRKDPMRNEHLIRPPGALVESEFLSTCIRCGGCMKVCPENFLQPAFLQAGLEGLWTPVGDPNYGYCLYNCNLCGQICPTGAIKNLPLADKKRFVIGTAYFDKDRCLPYAFGINCMVCEEHCPTAPKAIVFEVGEITTIDGLKKKVHLPKIKPDLCIGCGICQYKCPITDKPAIYITAVKKGGTMGVQ